MASKINFSIDFTCHYPCAKFSSLGVQTNKKMRKGAPQISGALNTPSLVRLTATTNPVLTTSNISAIHHATYFQNTLKIPRYKKPHLTTYLSNYPCFVG